MNIFQMITNMRTETSVCRKRFIRDVNRVNRPQCSRDHNVRSLNLNNARCHANVSEATVCPVRCSIKEDLHFSGKAINVYPFHTLCLCEARDFPHKPHMSIPHWDECRVCLMNSTYRSKPYLGEYRLSLTNATQMSVPHWGERRRAHTKLAVFN